MREFEFQSWQWQECLSLKMWFAVIGIGEAECSGGNAQIASQQLSKATARHDEVPPIFFEMKTRCSGLLIRREKSAKTFHDSGRLLQQDPPDMHLCGAERRLIGR